MYISRIEDIALDILEWFAVRSNFALHFTSFVAQGYYTRQDRPCNNVIPRRKA